MQLYAADNGKSCLLFKTSKAVASIVPSSRAGTNSVGRAPDDVLGSDHLPVGSQLQYTLKQ
eukprot:1434433-Pleurochrysis_carterae.AAC.3